MDAQLPFRAVPTENSVMIEPVELEGNVACDMFEIIFSLFYSIWRGLQSRDALHAQILALRHQVLAPSTFEALSLL
jgi:hypothetical protein